MGWVSPGEDDPRNAHRIAVRATKLRRSYEAIVAAAIVARILSFFRAIHPANIRLSTTRTEKILAEDAVCLADYCDIMRCQVLIAHGLLSGGGGPGTDVEVWQDVEAARKALAPAAPRSVARVPPRRRRRAAPSLTPPPALGCPSTAIDADATGEQEEKRAEDTEGDANQTSELCDADTVESSLPPDSRQRRLADLQYCLRKRRCAKTARFPPCLNAALKLETHRERWRGGAVRRQCVSSFKRNVSIALLVMRVSMDGGQRRDLRAELAESLMVLKSSGGAPGGGKGGLLGRRMGNWITPSSLREWRKPPRDGGELAREELRLEMSKLGAKLVEMTTQSELLMQTVAQASAASERVAAQGEVAGGGLKAVRCLSEEACNDRLISTIEEAKRGVKEEAAKTRASMTEGLSELRDEVIASAAFRPAMPSLREELSQTGQPNREYSGKDESLGGEGEWTRVESRAESRRRRCLAGEPEPEPPATSYPLLVESIDPRHTSATLIELIKSKVNVAEMGIGVRYVRGLRNQRASFGLASESERDTMRGAIKEKCPNVTISTPFLKKPLIRLAGVAGGLSDAQIPEAILKQNASLLGEIPGAVDGIRVLRRQKGRTRETQNIVLEVSAGVWSRLKDKRVRLGYQMLYATDQSPIKQCYRCLGYGHFARECSAKWACGHCAEEHDTRQCPARDQPPVCIGCVRMRRDPREAAHPAYSMRCPRVEQVGPHCTVPSKVLLRAPRGDFYPQGYAATKECLRVAEEGRIAIVLAQEPYVGTKMTNVKAQLLTGHGGVRQYLHRFGLAASPYCVCDDESLETVPHVLLTCARYGRERLDCEQAMGRALPRESEPGALAEIVADPHCRKPFFGFALRALIGAAKLNGSRVPEEPFAAGDRYLGWLHLGLASLEPVSSLRSWRAEAVVSPAKPVYQPASRWPLATGCHRDADCGLLGCEHCVEPPEAVVYSV
ncbi:hypothetical protein MSG28_012021 [Choristoneura fumiferana]|uniref:Uncharacterized protein n=1 Tax=Choristoneura fumiferana TaxID=7141 RepID=A0ACC0KNB9_CHOFU|nr:hypothetical protein MSG28_012021 [Choristoneura fumiferana]